MYGETLKGHHTTQPQGLGFIKVKVGNDQEIARSEINSHSKNRGGKY